MPGLTREQVRDLAQLAYQQQFADGEYDPWTSAPVVTMEVPPEWHAGQVSYHPNTGAPIFHFGIVWPDRRQISVTTWGPQGMYAPDSPWDAPVIGHNLSMYQCYAD